MLARFGCYSRPRPKSAVQFFFAYRATHSHDNDVVGGLMVGDEKCCQKASEALDIERFLAEEAKERQREAGVLHGRGKGKVPENFPGPTRAG